MSNTTKSPRCHHLRFFRLTIGEKLDINMVPFKKVGAFSARNSFTGALRRVMPWDKVRSRRTVKVEAPCWQKPFPENMGQTIERGPAYRGIIAGNLTDKQDSAALALVAFNIIAGPGKMGCQGDGDASGDRTPESIGGTEKTPSS